MDMGTVTDMVMVMVDTAMVTRATGMECTGMECTGMVDMGAAIVLGMDMVGDTDICMATTEFTQTGILWCRTLIAITTGLIM